MSPSVRLLITLILCASVMTAIESWADDRLVVEVGVTVFRGVSKGSVGATPSIDLLPLQEWVPDVDTVCDLLPYQHVDCRHYIPMEDFITVLELVQAFAEHGHEANDEGTDVPVRIPLDSLSEISGSLNSIFANTSSRYVIVRPQSSAGRLARARDRSFSEVASAGNVKRRLSKSERKELKKTGTAPPRNEDAEVSTNSQTMPEVSCEEVSLLFEQRSSGVSLLTPKDTCASLLDSARALAIEII
jgi:hypothetical protein